MIDPADCTHPHPLLGRDEYEARGWQGYGDCRGCGSSVKLGSVEADAAAVLRELAGEPCPRWGTGCGCQKCVAEQLANALTMRITSDIKRSAA